jgi:hypothetical protein
LVTPRTREEFRFTSLLNTVVPMVLEVGVEPT